MDFVVGVCIKSYYSTKIMLVLEIIIFLPHYLINSQYLYINEFQSKVDIIFSITPAVKEIAAAHLEIAKTGCGQPVSAQTGSGGRLVLRGQAGQTCICLRWDMLPQSQPYRVVLTIITYFVIYFPSSFAKKVVPVI